MAYSGVIRVVLLVMRTYGGCWEDRGINSARKWFSQKKREAAQGRRAGWWFHRYFYGSLLISYFSHWQLSEIPHSCFTEHKINAVWIAFFELSHPRAWLAQCCFELRGPSCPQHLNFISIGTQKQHTSTWWVYVWNATSAVNNTRATNRHFPWPAVAQLTVTNVSCCLCQHLKAVKRWNCGREAKPNGD